MASRALLVALLVAFAAAEVRAAGVLETYVFPVQLRQFPCGKSEVALVEVQSYYTSRDNLLWLQGEFGAMDDVDAAFLSLEEFMPEYDDELEQDEAIEYSIASGVLAFVCLLVYFLAVFAMFYFVFRLLIWVVALVFGFLFSSPEVREEYENPIVVRMHVNHPPAKEPDYSSSDDEDYDENCQYNPLLKPLMRDSATQTKYINVKLDPR
mmetsp:Transcript_2029/g.4631  ORF Transcript_2029/g.4631 Transcript_2029/m.4631 type:complete len:209 (+) Transcript_2029:124-750(+)